jgi:hypothetical protein
MLATTPYRRCLAIRKPQISKRNRKQRVAWVRERLHWTPDQWREVVWSDESRVALRPDGDRRVWRKPSEKKHNGCTIPTFKHNGGGVMVWGCASWYTLGPLAVVQGTLNATAYQALLQQHLVPFLRQEMAKGREPIFQQDNAPCHASRSTMAWMSSNDINCPVWPAQSPDLNPIERVWYFIKLGLKAHQKQPSSTDELAVAIQEKWARLSLYDWRKVVDSMGARCAAVIKARGATQAINCQYMVYDVLRCNLLWC